MQVKIANTSIEYLLRGESACQPRKREQLEQIIPSITDKKTHVSTIKSLLLKAFTW